MNRLFIIALCTSTAVVGCTINRVSQNSNNGDSCDKGKTHYTLISLGDCVVGGDNVLHDRQKAKSKK